MKNHESESWKNSYGKFMKSTESQISSILLYIIIINYKL